MSYMRGSIINLAGGKSGIIPEVGMGATVLYWTDRQAVTIVEVSKNKRTVGIRFDKATRTDNNGMSEDQDYSYESTEGPAQRYYTLRKNGMYILKGDPMDGEKLHIGVRNQYHDYSF